MECERLRTKKLFYKESNKTVKERNQLPNYILTDNLAKVWKFKIIQQGMRSRNQWSVPNLK